MLVEHSTIVRHGKIQRQLLHKEYTASITKWLSTATYRINPSTISNIKDTYGFKSAKNPPPIEELKEFENSMLKMIQSTKFKHINSPFLNKLKDDAIKIKNETKLLIAADKTTNFYKLEPSKTKTKRCYATAEL